QEKHGVIEGKVDWKGRPAQKHKHGGIKTAFCILVGIACENIATLALAVNLVTYFNSVMHLEVAEAANQLTNFMGVSNILAILVAILADAYIGRFRAVILSACLEILGLALLAIQAHSPKMKPPTCNVFDPTADCKKLKGGDAAYLYTALYLLAAGSAGLKASLPAHGADQFDEKDPQEARQRSGFFNYLLLAVCSGGAISITFIVWIQDKKGWDWGFAIGCLALGVGLLVFFAGLPLYRIQPIEGSTALTEILQVYVAAYRNRKLQLPEDHSQLYEISRDKEASLDVEFVAHRDIFRFLDRAAIQTTTETAADEQQLQRTNPWKLSRVTQVENAKIFLGMLPIFYCTIIMTLCLAQLQTFSIEQGLTMDSSMTKSFKIPPASLPIIPIAFLIILIPVYDQLCVPLIRRFTGHPNGITHLQRIGVGLILSCVSMAAASIMEVKRKAVARDHGMLDALPVLNPLPISTFWLSIQFFIFGVADMFTYIGLLEFFYSEAPRALKSMSTCFLWSSMALGYFLSTIMVKIVNRATADKTRSGGWLAGNNINRNHLNLFYLLLAVMSFVNFCVYLVVARRYVYRPKSSPADVTDSLAVHSGEKKSTAKDQV
ncbi:Protein NRT1/ PTR FAMILY 4.6, partial [Linum grandiflorum]